MGERDSEVESTLVSRTLGSILGNLDFTLIKPGFVGENHNWMCQIGVAMSWQ